MALAWLGGVKAEELRAGLASFRECTEDLIFYANQTR